MQAEYTLLVLLMCIAPPPLPLAAAASHSPLTPPPDMVATTPPHTETGEYTLHSVTSVEASCEQISWRMYTSYSVCGSPSCCVCACVAMLLLLVSIYTRIFATH